MSGYLFFHAKHPALAAIAAALEQAGNAFHNTSEWQGNAEWFDGKTPCELVQAAFDAADASLAESPPVVACPIIDPASGALANAVARYLDGGCNDEPGLRRALNEWAFSPPADVPPKRHIPTEGEIMHAALLRSSTVVAPKEIRVHAFKPKGGNVMRCDLCDYPPNSTCHTTDDAPKGHMQGGA